MGDSASVVQLLAEIKLEIAGISGFRYSNIIIAFEVAMSAFLGVLIQAWIQNSISKRNAREDRVKLLIQFKADVIKEELISIRTCASELFAEFDLVYNLISEQDTKTIEHQKIQELFFGISKKINQIGLSLSLNSPSQRAAYNTIRELYTISQEYALVYSVNNIGELGDGYMKEFDRLKNKYGASRHNGLIEAIEKSYVDKQDAILLQLSIIFDESWERIGQESR